MPLRSRRFPDPDPMLRFVDEQSMPYSIQGMPNQERGLRVRYYLIAEAAGVHPIVAWNMALDDSPQARAHRNETMAQWPTDAGIEEAVRVTRADRRPVSGPVQ